MKAIPEVPAAIGSPEAASPVSASVAVPHERRWFDRLLGLRPRMPRPRERLIRTSCDTGLSFGCSPNLADIQRLARREGLRTLLCLNTEGEPDLILSPNVEASWAHAFGLRHERVACPPDRIRTSEVERFLAAIRTAQRPVYVHSLHGQRAAAMMLVLRGLERRGASEEPTGLPIVCASAALRRFALSEVDRRLGR